ncbi:hypothetical protein CHGG_05065 [Chaetomium globosum CBS 148.51]|uniref:DDE-1 domain-containing protein n=1 Tax=Chaetomium globosum (strain ATCC 6205 / CBS 148.51 / DSM 1962 / NBRC 6347 / NRRL 1970) TaxID=306901 RepID=Q2GZI1_CHAGB|nr:uncharacterized protein CHGG_05065 [Chaetomium globosum CBS 148.51]EAQ88446.1 hypothetical protein CHGG_05065 [Chaetomium globosum CBS 148.51]
MRREWIGRWESEVARVVARNPGRALEPADATARFDASIMNRHRSRDPAWELSKAKSTLLVQARTGKIGLRGFLFTRRVPEVVTPVCRCGMARETFEHLVLECNGAADKPHPWPDDGAELLEWLDDVEKAAIVVGWVLGLGRLNEFRLAVGEPLSEEMDPRGSGKAAAEAATRRTLTESDTLRTRTPPELIFRPAPHHVDFGLAHPQSHLGKMSRPLQHEERIHLAVKAFRSGQIRVIRKAADAFDVPEMGTPILEPTPGFGVKIPPEVRLQRALCEDPEKVLEWLQRVQNTIESNGILDCDIYNFDETGFQVGVASTAKVVTRSERRNRPVVVQPGNRAENGWATDELTFEWLQQVFESQTRSRTVGRYRLLILDGHGSHMTPEFDNFCKENSILIECMPPHSSHLHQPLDVSCFSVLKRVYGDLVRGKMAVGIYHIDKQLFLELLFEAHTKTFTSKNIKSGFKATGLVPLDPSQVLARLRVRIRTPSPLPTPVQPSSTLPLKTPSNVIELDHLQRQRQRTNATSPTDRNLQKIIKGCQMAMHNATLLQEENSRLRAENTRQKQRRQHRRPFIQTGGSMTIGEGVATSEHQKVPKAQEARVEDQEAEVTAVEAVEPNVRKRAPPRCSLCNSTEHTARTCHCK